MQTAILGRFCAPLCGALTKVDKESSQEILQDLEHANLFLIPLDDERTWYRYHHLFQDLLAMRLEQSLPEQVTSLHRRAADWYESNGFMSEAVDHYIQGADFERAADLVEQHTVALFEQGKLDQLVGWIRKLPSGLSAHRPWLSIYQAWALAFAGKNQEAESLIEVAIQGLEQKAPSPEAQRNIWAEIHGIRALLSITSGNLQKALAFENMLDEFPADSLFARNVIVWSLGYAWRLQGELPKATAAFREVLAIGRQLNNVWVISTGFADLGMVLRLSGKLREAEAIYRESLEMMHQAGAQGSGYLGRSQSFLANLLCELNQLDEAWQLTLESIAHGQLWNNPNHLAHAYWTQARILYGKGDPMGAGNVLKKAEDIVANHPAIVPNLRAVIETFRVRLLLAQGRLSEADDWAETHPLPKKESSQNIEVFDMHLLTHARILIAQEKLSLAWKLLQELENRALAAGQKNTFLEVLTLKSLATSKRATALEVLESALELGIPEGYRRMFLDEGDRLSQLLGGLRGRSALVEPLLGARTKKPNLETLLTRREIDILRAMAEGLSNKEIGQRLFISTGTVKAHSAAIYRKLEVVNRTEAIARAKDLDLL
jgi:LuxR family maltose regulon positive regulatory protein